MSDRTMKLGFALAGGAAMLMLTGCEVGPRTISQNGYRGTAMAQIVDPDTAAPIGTIPAAAYALPEDTGPKASEVYQNVPVAGGLSAERFNHMMAQITQWVAPEQGCNYCHNPENMASDEKYTKIVARKMIQMTQQINSTWKPHVKATGVTCYTCHRGNVIPVNVWSQADPKAVATSIRGNKFGQNTPAVSVGYASLPYDPFTTYLEQKKNIRLAGTKSLPGTSTGVSTKDAEGTYALMMHFSKGLGVNCTYCHNTDSFASWSNSTPQRVTAWYGIRMVRDINNDYITTLASVFPANRKGPHGDVLKVNCATCHQGVNKPLGGQSMIADAPYLTGPTTAAAAPAATAPAAPAAGTAATTATTTAAAAAPVGVAGATP